MSLKLGVILDGQRNFVEELLEDWQANFKTSVYAFHPLNLPVANGRINPILYRRSLKNFIDRQDIVFFEWAGGHLVAASQLRTHTPIIVRLHSWELFHHAQQVHWDSVTRIILVSEAMQRHFCQRHPAQAEKTVVIPAGKSLTRFAPRPHAFAGNIAMLGNLIPIKRVYEVVLALAELNARGYHFKLHLGGKPGDDYNNQRYYTALLSAIDKLGLREQVILHGFVEAPEWLAQMDIYISNSYWEGQQNALIEAMAAGCYCLCHFWEGAEEILPAEHLYTTETALVDKIIAYSHMPEAEQRQRQERLRAIAVEKYDLTEATRRYREAIQAAWRGAAA